MEKKRLSQEEIDNFEAQRAERLRTWRTLPQKYKSYASGDLVRELQEEFVWETNEKDNQSFATPTHSHRFASEQSVRPLPACFNGDPNVQLTGGRHLQTANKKKSIYYNDYYKPAQKFAEEKWQAGEREITIIKDRDRKPLHPRSRQRKPNNPERHYPRLPKGYEEHAQKRYTHLHPTLASLLYLHDQRRWKFKSIAYQFASSPPQIERYYWIARLMHTLHLRVLKVSSED